MAKVVFTANLKAYTGGITETEADGERVCDLLIALDQKIPRIAHYVADEAGALRQHVNVFVNGAMVRDKKSLTDPVPSGATVHIMQALSGG